MQKLADPGSLRRVVGKAVCPTPGCNNPSPKVALAGFEVIEHCDPCQDAADDRMEVEERQERVRALIRMSGVEEGHLWSEWSMDTYPTDAAGREAIMFARTWLDRYRSGVRENVLLFGPTGGGKTGLAWAAIRDLMEHDLVRCKIKTFRETLDILKDSFKHSEPTQEMRNLKRVPVLVLDDLGSEKPTEFARTELLGLVDFRHLNRLPTWFTSNYLPGELAKRLGHDEEIIGKRILSRMVAGNAPQHRMDGKDRRL